MKVKIESQHIKEGVRDKPDSCALARALSDCNFRSVQVFNSWFVFESKEKKFSIELPREAVKFIKSFDDGFIVDPMEFEIDENAAKQIETWSERPHGMG
jgi:hypothetical protein